MSYARQTGDKPSIIDTYCLYLSEKRANGKKEQEKKQKDD